MIFQLVEDGAYKPELTAEFDKWVANAPPGRRLVYHHGFLCHDRSKQIWQGRVPTTHYWEPIHSIALAAKAAYLNGDVLLTQRRRGDGDFDYIATKRRHKGASQSKAPARDS